MAEQIPVGTIMLYAGSDNSSSIVNLFQNGWMLCDGSKYSRTSQAYSALFGVIGESFGGDDDSFCVPMLRGLFLRGVTGNTSTDPDAADRTPSRPDLPNVGNKGPAVGSLQSHAFQSHAHSYNVYSDTRDQDHIAAHETINNQNASSSTTSGVGDQETRPPNIYANFIIKFVPQDTAIPTGTIVPFAGPWPSDSLTGTGWLACDGSGLSMTDYADLHDLIGSFYGSSADGATFFLPDYRGLFVRGVQGTPIPGVPSYDPDTRSRTAPRPDLPSGNQGNAGNAVGSRQADAIGEHQHGYSYNDASQSTAATAIGFDAVAHDRGTDSHTTGSAGSSETRPVNIYVNYLIKAAQVD